MRRLIIIGALASALAACGEREPEVIIDPAPASNNGDFGDVVQPPAADAAASAPSAVNAPAEKAPQAAGTSAVGTAPASAAGQPRRKPGLWQLTASNGEASAASTLCVTEASEAAYDVFDTRRLLPMGPRPGGQGGQGADGERGPRAEGPPNGGARRGFGGGGACPNQVTRAGSGWTSTSRCTREIGDAAMTISTKDTVTGDLNSQYSLKASRTVSGAPMEQMNRTTNITVTGVYKGACPSGQTGGDLTRDGRTSSVLRGERAG